MMAIRIVPPEGVWMGWDWVFPSWHGRISILHPTLQCGQRWIFRIGRKGMSFGYRTYGDAKPKDDTYLGGGWYFWDDYFSKRNLKHTRISKGRRV